MQLDFHGIRLMIIRVVACMVTCHNFNTYERDRYCSFIGGRGGGAHPTAPWTRHGPAEVYAGAATMGEGGRRGRIRLRWSSSRLCGGEGVGVGAEREMGQRKGGEKKKRKI